jgi:uncharacterized ferredoxin-like protein
MNIWLEECIDLTIITSGKVEDNALLLAAKLMAVASRTSPKGKGEDHIVTLIVTGKEKESLAQAMELKVEEKRKRLTGFKRDAENLRKSPVVLLIGVKGTFTLGIDCGACGSSSCDDFIKSPKKQGEDFTGPICVFKAIDLGIALGSAVKMASALNVDNRMMYTIGAAAKALNLLEADVIVGIPLSSSGKSMYYDRK